MDIIYFIFPIILFISGLISMIISNKKINNFIGYRTHLSMKNEETWKFANETSGILFMRFSVISFFASIMFFAIKTNNNICMDIGLIFMNLVIIFITIFIVEKDLKNKF